MQTDILTEARETARWVIANQRDPNCGGGYYDRATWLTEAQWALDTDDYSEIADMLLVEAEYGDFREWQSDIPSREHVEFEGWELAA